MSSDGESERPSPNLETSPRSEECGNKEEKIPSNNGEGSVETTNVCGDLQDCESRKEEKPEENKLEKESDSGNPTSGERDNVNTRLNLKSSPEEVEQSELAQEEKEEVSEHNFKMDAGGANSIGGSSLNKDETMGDDDQSTQNEQVHEEVSEETSNNVQTEIGSKEIQLEEMDRYNETKNQAPGKETTEECNAESEVNQKETECPSQAKKTVTDVQDVADQSSTTMDSQPSFSAADKRQERMRKLHELRLRKNEARKLNHVEVIEEAKRNKRPSNWEARKRKVEWEAAEEEARKQAELDGEDYEKMKQMETSALELERREKKKMRKKNPDQGFSDFAQAQHRQYERLTKQMEPDMVAYEKTKMEMGESFYPGVNTIIHGHKPSESAIDRMVQDLDKQMEKRAKFSRRRGINEDADVDYINDRNMRFNKKAARFYDQYTLETKQNLERGTAV